MAGFGGRKEKVEMIFSKKECVANMSLRCHVIITPYLYFIFLFPFSRCVCLCVCV